MECVVARTSDDVTFVQRLVVNKPPARVSLPASDLHGLISPWDRKRGGILSLRGSVGH